MNKRLILPGIVIAAIASAIYYLAAGGTPPDGKYDEFAMCLAAKKVTMFGAAWCPHCQDQKKRFGTSFRYVPYVECPKNQDICTAAGVSRYPTWIFPGGPARHASPLAGVAGGEKHEGELELPEISRKAGCPLPMEK